MLMSKEQHYNRFKFPNDFFAIVLYINMAAVTSCALKEYTNKFLRASLVPNSASSVVPTTAVFVVSVELVLSHGSAVCLAQIEVNMT